MKTRTTLILLGLLALLLVYVLVFERGTPDSEDLATPAPTAPVMLALDVAGIQELRVEESSTGVRSVVARGSQDNLWYVEEPVSDMADQVEVRGLVQTLADLTATRVLTGSVDSPAAYGLDSPDLVVTLTLDDTVEVIRIGDETVTGGAFYAQVDDDDRISLVMSYIVADLRDFVDTPPVQPTPTPEPTPEEGQEPSPAATSALMP